MRPEDIITANKRALKPGQKFRFHCDQCGDCCRNREDILLTPFDLFRIAGHLGIAPGEVVKNHCETYIGSSSHFPVVRLLPVGEEKACPFLKENRCSIHASKPTVCALFPLGRAMQYGALKGDQARKLFYILQDVKCGVRDQTHTVVEWLGEFELEGSEAWFLEWTDNLEKFVTLIQQLDEMLSDELMQTLLNVVFVEIYLNYHQGVDFMEQFRGNSQKLLEVLQDIHRKCVEHVGGGQQ